MHHDMPASIRYCHDPNPLTREDRWLGGTQKIDRSNEDSPAKLSSMIKKNRNMKNVNLFAINFLIFASNLLENYSTFDVCMNISIQEQKGLLFKR